MARAKKKDKRGARKPNFSIQFLVEGETESYFIPPVFYRLYNITIVATEP